MEVIFDGSGGFEPFILKVDDFDNVGKIKERIEKYKGIPISRQSIWFNGEILPDDFNVGGCRIVGDGSTLILLLISADGDNNAPNMSQILGYGGYSPRLSEIRAYSQPPRSVSRWPPTMTVVVRFEDEVSAVEVREDEPVSELRRRLGQAGLEIPDHYLFLHRERVMDENQSFAC